METNQDDRQVLAEEKTLSVTERPKPEIPTEVIDKWQRVVNLSAKIIGLPTLLVVGLARKTMHTFLRSGSTSTIDTQGGITSLQLKKSSEKPGRSEVVDSFVYCGQPIHWPDGVLFGAICISGGPAVEFSESWKDLIREFSELIKKDLHTLVQNKELEKLAIKDGLTNVYNRRMLTELLVREIAVYQRYEVKFCVVMIDLNRFKGVNDQFGHIIGDDMLQIVARSFIENIRKTDAFGRFGGDEFLLICKNSTKTAVVRVMARIYKLVKAAMDKVAPNDGFSYGIGEVSKADTKTAEIIRRADADMYNRKS